MRDVKWRSKVFFLIWAQNRQKLAHKKQMWLISADILLYLGKKNKYTNFNFFLCAFARNLTGTDT